MQIVEPELEGDRGALLADLFLGLVLHFLDDFLDARRMDAAVRDQALDGFLRDLAAVGIEAGEDDRARRVVDDEIDAGGDLEGADVPPFTADDAALQVVAREIDDRYGRLDRVLGGAPLDRFGDVVLRAIDGGLARLGIEALEEVRRVVARLAFDLLDQQLLRFVGGEAGDALELVLLVRDELLVLRRGGCGAALAIDERAVPAVQLFLEALDRGLALGGGRFAAAERLLERGGLLAILPRLPLGLHQDLVRFFLGLEERFLAAGLGVALGVARDAERGLFRAPDRLGGDALAVRDPDGEGRRRHDRRDDRRDDDVRNNR